MSGLTYREVCLIQADVERESISFSHLADDLTDHLCCMTEEKMRSGLPFDEAYQEVRKEVGMQNLRKVQENTLLLIDKKYRIMKRLMKITAMLGLPIAALGGMFKIMHWPTAGILLLLGFAILGLLFYPASIFVLKKEAKIKAGSFVYIVALLGGMAVIFGVLFKIMHWPFSGILLLIAFFLLTALLIPTLLYSRLNVAKNGKERAVFILAAMFLMLILLGVCFKIFHWPGAALLLLAGSVLLTLVWLPLYAYNEYKKHDFVKGGFIYLCVAIVFFNLFNMLLALNLSKDALLEYKQPGITLKIGTESLEKYNHHLAALYAADTVRISSENRNRINEVEIMTSEICKYIEGLKIELIARVDFITAGEAEEVSKDFSKLINKPEYKIPTRYLCGDEESSSPGKGKELQLKIEDYRDKLTHCCGKNQKQSEFLKELLNLDVPQYAANLGAANWSLYRFYHAPAIQVLNTLSGLQYDLRIAECSTLNSLATK